MKISRAIELLQRTKEKHGDIDVFFDCPKCLTAFTPDIVETVAAHFGQREGEDAQ